MCKKLEELNILTYLTKYFTNGFEEILSTFTTAEKKKLLSLSPVFFKKWCYSTFFEDTVLSPANILNSYINKNENEVTYITYKIVTSAKGNKKYSYQLSFDSIDCHSFIKNLITFTDYCFPVATFYEDGMFPLKLPDDLAMQLTNTDGFYFEYLVLIAQRMNLITSMPSINTCKYQKNVEQCDRFFIQSNIKILTQLTDKVFEIFNEKFAELLQAPYHIVSTSIMKSFLKESITSDDIYSKVYSSLGFNFDNMLKMAENPFLSPENEALMSSAFVMGTVLDKWFFSPLGDYLKLITPLYCLPYNFMDETDFVRPILLTGCDVSADVFSPCNYFSLTSIGEEILKCENSNTWFQNISQDFTEEQIHILLSSTLHINHINITDYMIQKNKREIYTIKVSYMDFPTLWKIIQVPVEYTLSKLYELIATYFGFDKSDCYTFSILKKNKYEPCHANLGKKSSFHLNELFKDNNLILSNEFVNFNDLELKLINISTEKNICNYPRLLKQSRAITLEELNNDV